MAASPTSRLCELHTARGKVLLTYRMRRNSRARYLRVSVRDTGEVLLSVPARTSDSAAVDFLRSQGDWIMQALSRAPRPANLLEHLRRQPWISAGGVKLTVEVGASRTRTHWVANVAQGLVIIRCAEANGDPASGLRDALVEVGASLLPPHVMTLAKEVGVEVDRVCVRNQRTLWGSCSSRRTLSLNWRLVLLPPELQDHIIYHELAHLTHMDHSERFYNLLQRYDPRSPEHDHRVSKLSPQLMALGR